MKNHYSYTSRKKNDQGAAFVEFSVVATVLGIVLSLLIDIGQLLFLKMSISHVTLQVARDLAVLVPESARDDNLEGNNLDCDGLRQRADDIIAAQDYSYRYEALVPGGVEFNSISVVGGNSLPSLSVKGELSDDFQCLFCYLKLATLRPRFTATVSLEIKDEAIC